MVDLFERKIHYLRISITDLCNLKCQYCMPAEGIDKKDHQAILRIEEYLQIVEEMTKLGVDKIRLTGGEPLVRKGVVDLVRGISALDGIKDLSITTNGILLKKYAKELKDAGLSRVNVSIDTMDPDKYREITRGGNLSDVLEGIEEARRVGLLPIKLNVVLINGFNTDEVADFIQLADDDLDVRFIELMPFGQVASWTKDKFISNDEILNRHRDLLLVQDGEQQGAARYYQKKDGSGRVGFINPISNHFCATCNRVRMTADGKLKLCLHTNEEFDLKPLLSLGSEEIRETLKSYIAKKPERHHMNDQGYVPIARDMNRIGG